MKKYFLFVSFIIAGFIIWGCGGSHKYVLPTPEECPWCFKPPIAEDALYGVGTSNVGRNVSLAREKAADDARHQIGRQMKAKVKSLMDRFAQEHNDYFDENASMSSVEFTRTVSRTVSQAVLTGCRITDYYYDKNSNVYYALAELPRDNIAAEIINNARQQKAAFLEKKTDEALELLDKELKDWDLNK